MTNNQKLILGVGAIALAYWLYKRKGGGISRQAPITPKKENDANFSNFETTSSCLKKYCPPSRPISNLINGRCVCQTKHRTTQTVSSTITQ